MVGWSDLSEDTKREVVKKLDLMSRCSLRSTCHLDRQIVDSTKFYIPRVRISPKEEDFYVTIFTGIEKFLRVEFVRNEGGTIVYRMENSFDRKCGTIKRIPTITPYALALKTIKNLFIRDTVLLGTLEFEIFDDDYQNQMIFVTHMTRVFGKNQVFHTKKLVTNWKTRTSTDMLIYSNILDLKILKEMGNDALYQCKDNGLYPKKMIDVTLHPEIDWNLFKKQMFLDFVPLQKFIHVPTCDSNIYVDEHRYRVPLVMKTKATTTEGFATCRFGPECTDLDLWDIQKPPIEKLNDSVIMKRGVGKGGGLTTRWNKSKCGMWVHMMRSENEHKFIEFFKNEKCGLRWLCKECTDPFDYWYYRNYSRRIFLEQPPFDFVLLKDSNDENEQKECNEWYERLKKEFAKEKKSEVKTDKKSWGFRKNNKKKSFKKRPPVVFKHPDDYEDISRKMDEGESLHIDTMNKFKIFSEWRSKPKINKENMITMDQFKVLAKQEKSSTNEEGNSTDGIFSKIGNLISNWTPFKNVETPPEDVPPSESTSRIDIIPPAPGCFIPIRRHVISLEEFQKRQARGEISFKTAIHFDRNENGEMEVSYEDPNEFEERIEVDGDVINQLNSTILKEWCKEKK